MSYGIRSNGNTHGTVYTNREVVDFILNLCNSEVSGLSGKVIIDPAAGDGAFIIPIIQKIQSECGNNSSKLKNALSNLYIYEIESSVLTVLRRNIQGVLIEKNHIDFMNIVIGDFLLVEVRLP